MRIFNFLIITLFFLWNPPIGFATALNRNFEINFVFDENYNILHVLQKGRTKNTRLREMMNEVWEKEKKSYQILNGLNRISPHYMEEFNFSSDNILVRNALENLIKVTKESDYYPIFKNETEENLLEIKNEWNLSLDRCLPIMEELTGFNFSKKFDVFITHPDVGNGTNWGNGLISFGFSGRAWPNYTTVYLWHEILHDYFPRDDDLYHAIIQLITDNELRIRLNEGFYPPFEGHKNLEKLMYDLFPIIKEYWQMPMPKENILDFSRKITIPKKT